MTDLFPLDAAYEDALPPLRTPRLLLRPLAAADDAALVSLFSDARALETWVADPFTSLDDARAYRARLALGFTRRSAFVWGAFTAEGALAGVGLLVRWAPNHRRVYVGYYLHSAHWGRGYATEMARALLAFAFGTLGCHRVEAEIVPGNTASERVAARLGMTREARLRERLWGTGAATARDCDLYVLFRRDFEAAPPVQSAPDAPAD